MARLSINPETLEATIVFKVRPQDVHLSGPGRSLLLLAGGDTRIVSEDGNITGSINLFSADPSRAIPAYAQVAGYETMVEAVRAAKAASAAAGRQ